MSHQQSLFQSPYLNTLAAKIEQVQQNNREFIEACRNKARELCADKGFANPDDVREWADSMNIHPVTSVNAYGAIWKSPEFETCGLVKSRIPSNNGRRVFLWRLKNGI